MRQVSDRAGVLGADARGVGPLQHHPTVVPLRPHSLASGPDRVCGSKGVSGLIATGALTQRGAYFVRRQVQRNRYHRA